MNILQNPEVYKCLAVNTVHVRPITMQWLEDHKVTYYDDDFDSSGLAIYQTMGGFLLPDTNVDNLETSEIPEDLAKLIKFAATEGYGMMWIDGDAKEYPELPQFRKEWDQIFGQMGK